MKAFMLGAPEPGQFDLEASFDEPPKQSMHILARVKQKKAASKTKYTCPTCGANAWAKPDTQLICGACYEQEEEITLMTPEPAQNSQQEAA